MTVSVSNLSTPDLEACIQPGLEIVGRCLREAVSGSRDLVDQLISHLAFTGGKRLRPVLTLVCAQLGDPAKVLNEAVITGAAAVELIHFVPLYHDDVMDSASVRRGVPSVQHLWGNDRVILTGDVFFARASVFVVTLSLEMASHYTRTSERLCIGQLNETFGPEEGQDRVDFYIKVLADETGSLVTTAAHFGVWLSGAGEEVAAIVSGLGERIGVAFQIADNVIDPASNGDASREASGTDLHEGVGTFPVLLPKRRLIQGTIDRNGRRILETLDSDLSSDGALVEPVMTLCRHEVLEGTRQMAKDWPTYAIKTLEPLPEGEAKTVFIAFTRLMVDRLA